MKILHIGDIHLGCTLDRHPRNPELAKVFAWLEETVRKERVEAALLAGDIFDNGSPSNDSQEMYYGLLGRLLKAGCGQIVVIAGNHDHPKFLEAPEGLLRQMDIHVIGQVDPEHLEREIIVLGEADSPTALVCAVPYLRGGDVRVVPPEWASGAEQEREQADAIRAHYRAVYGKADALRAGRPIPILGMGHLDVVDDSYRVPAGQQLVGGLHAVDFTGIPPFDYLALGHIHKPKPVCGREHWRYAGALLPMNLGEETMAPQVTLVDTADLAHPRPLEVPVSCFHKMRVVRGDLPELRRQLAELRDQGEEVWVKTIYTGTELLPNWVIDLRQEMRDTPVQIVVPETRREVEPEPASPEEEVPSIEELTPEKVFLDYLDRRMDVTDASQRAKLVKRFHESDAKVEAPTARAEDDRPVAQGVMKFRRLYFKNVNSLYGDHAIDFDDDAFQDGIFLICGNTGAGKSSILDAICLALYGRTPRVKDITMTQDSVMSHGAKELAAKLTFTIGEKTYRAEFGHKRTEHAQSPFRAVERRLYVDGREEPGTARQIDAKICDLLGMSIDQFTRCVLLAQGSFDAFMKANEKERSEILKRITGTELFTRVGEQINQDFNAVKREYEAASASLDGIPVPAPEALEALRQAAEAARGEHGRLAQEAVRLREREKCFAQVEKAEAEQQAAEAAAGLAAEAHAQAAPRRQEYADGVRAQKCEAAYQLKAQRAAEAKNASDEWSALVARQPGLEQAAGKAKQELSGLAAALEAAEQDAEKQQALFREVRALDTRIAEAAKARAAAEAALQHAQGELKQADAAFARRRKAWQEEQAKAAAASAYLEAHGADDALEHWRPVWEEQRRQVVAAEAALERQAQAVGKLKRERAKAETELKRRQKELSEAKAAVARLEEALAETQAQLEAHLGGRTQEELEQLREEALRVKNYWDQARGLAERRQKLKAGEPCPLCGATEHPYCDNAPVAEDKDPVIRQLEAQLAGARECGRRQAELGVGLGLKKGAVDTAQAKCDAQAETLRGKELSLAEAETTLEGLRNQAEERVTRLTEELREALQVEWGDHAALPRELEPRIQAYADARRQVAAKDAAGQEFANAQSAHEAARGTLEQNRQRAQLELEQRAAECVALERGRREMFGEASVAEREKALAGQVKAAQRAKEKAADASTQAESALQNNRQRQAEAKAKADALAPVAAQAAKEFAAALAGNGFGGEADFLEKRRSPEQLQVLNTQLQELAMALTTANAMRDERRRQLDELRRTVPEGVERAANLAQLAEAEGREKAAYDTMTDLDSQVKSARQTLEQFAAAQRRRDGLKPNYDLWTILNDHFGSTNGTDRFGRIAQGYTFRVLLDLANKRRLPSLQRHFTLVSDATEPLELNVRDHFRGDITRTSRNLSGGECFEVSLALALGLAEMSAGSQKARLGNVLLDEGFGTLDAEALDGAIELLTQLQGSDRKLVGIISHVERLKERIPAKIEVTNTDGMGELSGAGILSVGDIRRQPEAEHPAAPRRTRKA